jgi:hypothetical protein
MLSSPPSWSALLHSDSNVWLLEASLTTFRTVSGRLFCWALKPSNWRKNLARILGLWLQGCLGTPDRSIVPGMAPISGTLQRSVRSSRSRVLRHYAAFAESRSCLDMTAAKNHKHAVNNPYAQSRDGWTEEQVLNSLKVAEQVTKLMCTPTSVRHPVLCARKH